MKVRIFSFLFNLYSMSAVAGYDCILKMSHVDAPERVQVTRVLTTEEGVHFGREGMLGPKYSIEAYTNAQVAEEELEFSITDEADGRMVSEKIQLKGNDRRVTFFDTYKLISTCEIRS